MNDRHPATTKRVGRPPRLQSMVVSVLQSRPELQGRPSDLARYIRSTNSSFSELKGSNVSIAFSKLRRRFGDFFDPGDLHADQYHVEKLVLADDGEKVCPGCGATAGYQKSSFSSPLDEGLRGQNTFVNPLHRALRTNPIPIAGRKEGMISKAAVTIAEFGDGVEGRLLEKALKGFEQLCKSNRRHQLPQEMTAQMAGMIEADCKVRARGLKAARTDEAQQAVISSCVKAMEKFPLYEGALRGMVLNASAYFPDLTASAAGRHRKGRSGLLLDEEELISRETQREESKWPDARPELAER